MGSLWNRSGIVERYADDLRANGAKAYFFSGGTTTPLTVYQDAGEGSAHPHPVVADANGRWPDVFVPYIQGYDVQVKSADDVQLTYSIAIPNPDPVDLTVIPPVTGAVETGMVHAELVNTTRTGYVRLNGRTMGNASSGGTERANADTQLLFIYLWTNLSNTIAPVSGGRGGSASADFAANKNITLVDCRGASLRGLDNMGNSAGSFFSGLTFSIGDATTAGSRLGANGVALALANMPAHTHGGTTNQESPTHSHSGTTGNQSASHNHTVTVNAETQDHTHDFAGFTDGPDVQHTHAQQGNTVLSALGGAATSGGVAAALTGGNTGVESNIHGHNFSGTTGGKSATHTHSTTVGDQSASHTHTFSSTSGGAHTHGFTTDSKGSGTAFNNLGRSVLVTWYIKL